MKRIGTAAELAPSYTLAIVGAGPAGMAAAVEASRHGLAVLLVDENATLGGQIYRNVAQSPVRNAALFGTGHRKGAALVRELEAAAVVDYAPSCTLWAAEQQPGGRWELGLSLGGRAVPVPVDALLLATGAQERPCPMPGWTLPGVMSAGAAQTLLKSSGLVPSGRVVLAGSGPLLVLLASQLHAAGVTVAALLDTTPPGNLRAALPELVSFLRSPYLLDGLKLISRMRRATRTFRAVTDLRIEGQSRAERIVFTHRSQRQSVACDLVLLHQGVIPAVNVSNALGCAHRWNEGQRCWEPVVDEWGKSSVPAVYLAGDGAGIGGAVAAEERGRLAALAIAAQKGQITLAERDAAAVPHRAALARALTGRRYIDLLFRPTDAAVAPAEAETPVCRCEEMTAGEIRTAARTLKVSGPNQMKAFLRCGMGPCQGRMCASTVAELIAQERGLSMAEVGMLHQRLPVKPVTLGELAGMPGTEDAAREVAR